MIDQRTQPSRPAPLPRAFRPLLACTRAESIRRQESGLILLNLTVLAGLAGLHVLFSPALGAPSRLFFAVVFGRFAMQVAELLGLHLLPDALADRLLPPYAHATIWLNVGFAFLIAWLAHFEDSHYVALMVIPVIAAAFRYRWSGIALVVAAAVTLTFLQVWLYFQSQGVVDLSEYFEATNVMLIYVVVAVIVSFLARQVRSEQAALERNLAELERTRDRLVEEEKLAAVGRLASAVAHEIRNPVSLIVQLARDGPRGSRQPVGRRARGDRRRRGRAAGEADLGLPALGAPAASRAPGDRPRRQPRVRHQPRPRPGDGVRGDAGGALP